MKKLWYGAAAAFFIVAAWARRGRRDSTAPTPSREFD